MRCGGLCRASYLINVKCHDLKHQLGKLKNISDSEERKNYIAETQKSIVIYDAFDENGDPLTGDIVGATMRDLYNKSAEQGSAPAVKWCEGNAKFNKLFQEEFVKLCEKLSEYSEEEMNAFLNDYDD